MRKGREIVRLQCCAKRRTRGPHLRFVFKAAPCPVLHFDHPNALCALLMSINVLSRVLSYPKFLTRLAIINQSKLAWHHNIKFKYVNTPSQAKLLLIRTMLVYCYTQYRQSISNWWLFNVDMHFALEIISTLLKWAGLCRGKLV